MAERPCGFEAYVVVRVLEQVEQACRCAAAFLVFGQLADGPRGGAADTSAMIACGG